MSQRTTRRDPTVLLVVGLVLVVAALLVTRSLVGDADDGLANASSQSVAPSATTSPAPSDAPLTPPDAVSPPGKPGKPGRATDRPTRRPARDEGSPPPLDIERQGRRQCVATDEDVDVTVVSYNIKSGHGGGTLGQIAATLRDTSADVVLLQEVDQLRIASGRVDQPAYFGAALDMAFSFGKNVPHAGGGGYGTVILSRYPLVSAENTFLPQPAGTQRRGLLHVVVDVDGTEVSIYNTHLQNADPAARMLQAAAIVRLVSDDPRPRILGGDLNTPPGSPPWNTLIGSWADTWDQVGAGTGRTAPAGSPRARIDYLLYGGEGLAPLAMDVLPAKLSDHLGVRAAYRLAAVGEPICFQRLG